MPDLGDVKDELIKYLKARLHELDTPFSSVYDDVTGREKTYIQVKRTDLINKYFDDWYAKSGRTTGIGGLGGDVTFSPDYVFFRTKSAANEFSKYLKSRVAVPEVSVEQTDYLYKQVNDWKEVFGNFDEAQTIQDSKEYEDLVSARVGMLLEDMSNVSDAFYDNGTLRENWAALFEDVIKSSSAYSETFARTAHKVYGVTSWPEQAWYVNPDRESTIYAKQVAAMDQPYINNYTRQFIALNLNPIRDMIASGVGVLMSPETSDGDRESTLAYLTRLSNAYSLIEPPDAEYLTAYQRSVAQSKFEPVKSSSTGIDFPGDMKSKYQAQGSLGFLEAMKEDKNRLWAQSAAGLLESGKNPDGSDMFADGKGLEPYEAWAFLYAAWSNLGVDGDQIMQWVDDNAMNIVKIAKNPDSVVSATGAVSELARLYVSQINERLPDVENPDAATFKYSSLDAPVRKFLDTKYPGWDDQANMDEEKRAAVADVRDIMMNSLLSRIDEQSKRNGTLWIDELNSTDWSKSMDSMWEYAVAQTGTSQDTNEWLSKDMVTYGNNVAEIRNKLKSMGYHDKTDTELDLLIANNYTGLQLLASSGGYDNLTDYLNSEDFTTQAEDVFGEDQIVTPGVMYEARKAVAERFGLTQMQLRDSEISKLVDSYISAFSDYAIGESVIKDPNLLKSVSWDEASEKSWQEQFSLARGHYTEFEDLVSKATASLPRELSRTYIDMYAVQKEKWQQATDLGGYTKSFESWIIDNDVDIDMRAGIMTEAGVINSALEKHKTWYQEMLDRGVFTDAYTSPQSWEEEQAIVSDVLSGRYGQAINTNLINYEANKISRRMNQEANGAYGSLKGIMSQWGFGERSSSYVLPYTDQIVSEWMMAYNPLELAPTFNQATGTVETQKPYVSFMDFAKGKGKDFYTSMVPFERTSFVFNQPFK